MKNLLLTLLLLLPLHAEAKLMKTGPEYMPAEMEPVTAPFDVSGISRPVFADRTRTVKMNKRGLSTRQIQTAIDRMSRQGGGTVIVPDGQWTSGRIELKSGVCLHLSDSAVLTFSGRISDYQPAVPTRNEGYDVMSLGAMIYANGAENIGLTGRGHIVGPSTDCEIYQENRKYLVVEECVDITKPIAERLCDGQQGRPVLLPMTVAPVNCKNVLIEGITIDQGLFWNIVPQYCDNVIIRGVTVNSAGHGRTDGIDIESTTNSLIEYCQLDCGDDCYTIKSGRGEDGVRTARPSVGCVIRHSVALRGGGGLVLGSETAASMWNIYMHDCRFEGTEQGIRIKTRRPRGGGAHDVWVERVMARNIKWNGLTVDMLGSKKWVGELANRFPARQVNELTPEFKNIYIKDFTVDGCQRLIDVKALPERPLTNVLIENFEGRGKDFLRLQDVSGFVMKGGKIHTPEPTAVLDGCSSVALVGMDYDGKPLKQHLKNATIYQPEQRDQLWQAFLTPPDSIRVGCYYYWVNEQVDPKGVVADLEWMKDNGITLAFLATDIRNRTTWDNPWEGQAFGKNKFQSRLWWKNLRTALKTAGELGIEMGLFNCPGWSQSGGPWVRPEEAMRNWTPGGIEICKTKQGADVTCGPCSNEAEGLEVDKLSKHHVQKHFESFIGEILRRIPPKERKTLTTVVVDSWERGKQNYTDSIYIKFRQRFGYELDYTNPACQNDLNRLISDLVASEYMGGLSEKAHEYGLRTWCEPYAHSPFPGNSITYGSAADEVGAEFWVNDRKFRKKEVDAALGAARNSGKNRIWAESFTDGAWDKVAQDDWSFEKLKPIADRYFHAGVNAIILHVMISQPGDDRQPAVRPWFGTYFDRRSQHAADLKPLVSYLRRCCFMLQIGKPFNGATDCRILNDGTKIRFTEESLFEVTFPDGRLEYWNPAQPQPSATAMTEQFQFSKAIVSGVSWYDQQGKTVSAHGANIIRDGGKYYLFGEYKTDSANVFKGFSCYSSDNLVDWHFEGIAFNQQSDGRMGPYRVGERPKVLRCPATGEYVMLMHTDNLQYKDPCTCYATSQAITGPYKFQGPLLYKGEPVRKWDIGSFADDDGHAYLLVHHGIIYRLASDFHSLDSCLMNGLKGAGESPAMLKKDGTYYWLSSHTTSWERNDNMYWTSKSLSGPWEYRGEFCPKGSLTWNSQCSFVLPLENGSFMYMGDRWSFPRQRSAATYVWQPLNIADGKLTIPQYFEAWDPLTMQQVIVNSTKLHEKKWQSQVIGDSLSIPYTGRRIALYGTTDSMSGYADITIRDQRGHKVFGGIVDFYSLVPATGIRFLSPMLAKGKYTLELRIAEMKPNWTDKRRNQYGSTGHKVEITHVMIE